MERKEKIERIKSAIEELRLAIQKDGGDIEFVNLYRNNIHVKLKGKCEECALQEMTLNGFVLPFIKGFVPDVKKIKISRGK